ncbi:CbiM family transporter [Gracilibacillus lacisalsi]|uniref:CbiM family transporter n=1 Tax=Gracilibacillus lacisalsi TaxID=393087 RepID=UPI00035EACFE|nr:CbiM family transporter [Gracilibacillus lacisalsi]
MIAMHVADGVLSVSVAIATTAGAAVVLSYALKGTSEEEIPKISLLSGAFFVASLINIPVGPTSVHPLLGGFLGLVLGRRAPLAVFVGLILQTLLFQHGGISTFGANFLLMSIPALMMHWLFRKWKSPSTFWKGAIAGFTAVGIGVALLVLLLLLSDARYGSGFFSVTQMVLLAYFPLALLEATLTAFAIKHLASVRPHLLDHLTNQGVDKDAK